MIEPGTRLGTGSAKGERRAMTSTTISARRTRPPFRADHVGSLLRPDALKTARDTYLGPQTPATNLGPHDSTELRAVEDQCVLDLIAMQGASDCAP
jgi:5-methyltetrahydropteroyltriglutamate--homocysteine methyltransferase